MYIAKHFLNEKSILYFYFGERIARVMASKKTVFVQFRQNFENFLPMFLMIFSPNIIFVTKIKMGQRRLVQGFKARPAAQRSPVRYPPSEYFQSIYILENEFKDFCQKPTTAASR